MAGTSSVDREATRPEPRASRGYAARGYGRRVKLELLYWEGCPSYPEARTLLEEVLATAEVDARIEMRKVKTQQEAEQLRFPGSPTIRVDGHDVDPAGARARPALTCRIYRLPDGRVSPIPSREDLEAALT